MGLDVYGFPLLVSPEPLLVSVLQRQVDRQTVDLGRGGQHIVADRDPWGLQPFACLVLQELTQVRLSEAVALDQRPKQRTVGLDADDRVAQGLDHPHAIGRLPVGRGRRDFRSAAAGQTHQQGRQQH
mgnify:CR=1 FL=1